MSIIGTLTTGEWIVVGGSVLLLFLSGLPILWLSWRFVQMSDDSFTRTVDDVQRFVARNELAQKALSPRPLAARDR